jgi:uncharacterized iron-regulated membrane protein
MHLIDLLHRWTGGIVGLVLAVLGLSGALLLHKHVWIMAPHASDPLVKDVSGLGATVTRLMTKSADRPGQIRFASEDFGLHQLVYDGGAGAYADQAGTIVTRWESQWERPEIWLFDLHHHLFAGHVGETIAGLLSLVGIGFIVTGAILWWRLRKIFAFRIWPARMSRPAIVRQHRDLGIVLSPLLFLSLLTGAMMVLRPVADLLLSPWTPPAQMRASMAPPDIKGGPLAAQPVWTAMLVEARRRYPDAELRVLSLPRKEGDLVELRMKQPEEWLPNGRTAVWFEAGTGRLVAARNGLQMPRGARIFNMLYPIHAAKVGGLPYRVVMTISGLGLTMLGTLAVWSFWFRRNRKPRPLQHAPSAHQEERGPRSRYAGKEREGRAPAALSLRDGEGQ